MIVILRDRESLDDDVVFITETTTGEQIQEIIDDVKVSIGDTDNYNWEEIEKRLPEDVKVYTNWNNEFDVIYW